MKESLEGGRKKLWLLLCILGWAEGVLGLILLTFSAKPLLALYNLAPDTFNFKIVYLSSFATGIAVSAVSLMGVIVTQNSLKHAALPATVRTHRIWFGLSAIMSIFILMSAFIIPSELGSADKEIIDEAQRGMRKYLTDPRWRFAFDTIQQNYKCCGIYSFEDWYKLDWIPIDSLRTDLTLQNKDLINVDGSLKVGVVPPSCCKVDVNVPCLHDALLQNDTSSIWLGQELPYYDTVYTKGCQEEFFNKLSSNLSSFGIIAALIVIFQICQMIIESHIHSSTMQEDTENKRKCSEKKQLLPKQKTKKKLNKD
ncbi:peripherin-2-like [Cimex lectularius]|uniref:Tetraspanin n=1 Tax=Cimex lectularius TaxID=79782 RepID=A0A8I6SPB6_CIMLE|nr:peripherin-2-like [Cimex lectularius]